MLDDSSPGKQRFRNQRFLDALGEHCEKLRKQRGLSIDRLSKESDQLSPSVIHRLEKGSGAVTVLALYRYASALNLTPKDLLEFELPLEAREQYEPEMVSLENPRVKSEAYQSLLPLYSIKAAAGYFGQSAPAEPKAWIQVGKTKSGAFSPGTFVVQALGDSMLPKIHDGDYLVFQANPSGSKQGKIVLAQYRGPADPDTGGSYTVKKYSSSKVAANDSEGSEEGEWRHRQITLSPLNPDFEPIILYPKDAGDFKIIGEYLFTL